MERGVYEINRMSESFPLKIFSHRVVQKMNPKIPRHWHRSIEILYILGGDMTLWVNGETKNLKHGDVEIIHSGIPHEYQFVGKRAGCSMLFAYDFLKEIYPEIDNIRFVLDRTHDSYQKLIKALDTSLHIFHNRDEFYNLLLHSEMYEILHTLLLNFKVEKEAAPEIYSEKYAERYKRIISYINEHYPENLTLGRIAQEFGFSDEHFSRSFKKYMKIGYKEYLTRIRLYYARNLVVESDLTMTDIANECGFGDNKSFIRDFKEIYETTPLQYRFRSKDSTSVVDYTKAHFTTN
ncbi:AraC family transcriptional regulator [Paenibacillus sp. FSL R10-2734]|uniref:helix-turn-helix transcriptional regulator n=1 Tax=Paenibacillus sp. FSL R10-2734 TaxID=2954691 RepID=UPI0030DAD5F7